MPHPDAPDLPTARTQSGRVHKSPPGASAAPYNAITAPLDVEMPNPSKAQGLADALIGRRSVSRLSSFGEKAREAREAPPSFLAFPPDRGGKVINLGTSSIRLFPNNKSFGKLLNSIGIIV